MWVRNLKIIAQYYEYSPSNRSLVWWLLSHYFYSAAQLRPRFVLVRQKKRVKDVCCVTKDRLADGGWDPDNSLH